LRQSCIGANAEREARMQIANRENLVLHAIAGQHASLHGCADLRR
jgi:hypothetical protein